MKAHSKAGRPVIGWCAVVASFGLIALTVAFVGMARGEKETRGEAALSADAVELVDARRALEFAALDVVAVRMLDGVGANGDRTERGAAAEDGVRQAFAAITMLAEGDGPVASEAAVLIDDIDPDVFSDPLDADIAEVFYVAEDAARYAGATEVFEARLDVIYQIGFTATLAPHILIEGIAGDVSVNELAIEPSLEDFFEMITDVVRNDGGWLGVDPVAPFDGSEWIEIDEAWEVLPAETARLEAMFIESPVVEYDAWSRELGDGSAQPPFDMTEIVALSDELRDQSSVVIDELIASEFVEREQAAIAQESTARNLFLMAAGSGAAALVVFILGVRTVGRAARSSRERAALALRDALTGVGNRHELEHRTRMLTSDLRFAHHAVVMIDLDRFKMVNDVHGHAAGDAVLIEVADRLTTVAAEMSSRHEGAEHSVVRLGGDEFLVTLHGPEPFAVADIHAMLDGIRGEAIEYERDRIGLGFSMGIVPAAGANDLNDLMAAADLAVYEDKSARAAARQPTFETLPPPQPGTDQPISSHGS